MTHVLTDGETMAVHEMKYVHGTKGDNGVEAPSYTGTDIANPKGENPMLNAV